MSFLMKLSFAPGAITACSSLQSMEISKPFAMEVSLSYHSSQPAFHVLMRVGKQISRLADGDWRRQISICPPRKYSRDRKLAPSGEDCNGRNLVAIQDRKVAPSYAIEALRIFDHLHFRLRMQKRVRFDEAEKLDPR